jgi:hypothetical protein
MERLGKHVLAAMEPHAIRTVFSAWSVPRCYKQGTRLELGQLVCEEKTELELQECSVGREGLSMEAEK